MEESPVIGDTVQRVNTGEEIEPGQEGDRRSGAAVQSVDRALMVLEILGAQGSAGITEIADELGVHKSTVSRLVAVLEARGFVEQLADRGKYRLGFTVVRLAGATVAGRDLAKASQARCDALAEEVGETVNLAILEGDRAINIVEATGPAGVSLRTWVGQASPVHATSSGKVLVCEMVGAELRERLGEKLDSFTDNTITNYVKLERELAEVRERGWAYTVEELETGLHALAAPVRDNTGKIVAALSISGPAYRMPEARFAELAARACVVAGEIGMRLGYLPRINRS